jgi:glyoxylase I family protein
MTAYELRSMAPLLAVYDMPAALHFYRDLLGFEVVATDGNPSEADQNWVLLERDEIQIMLNTAYDPGTRPAEPDRKRIAAHDDAALFFSCPDVDAVYRDLRDKGVDLAPPRIAPYGMKQLSLKDPDGFAICFQWPASEDESARKEPGT